jgi:hypothetical protein
MQLHCSKLISSDESAEKASSGNTPVNGYSASPIPSFRRDKASFTAFFELSEYVMNTENYKIQMSDLSLNLIKKSQGSAWGSA